MKLAYTIATPDTSDTGVLALRGDLIENFRTLAELGYEGAELMVRDPARLSVDQIRSIAGDRNLRIAAVSTGQLRKEDGFSLAHLEDRERERAIARTRDVIDFAAELDAQVNIGTLRGHLPAGPARAEGLAAARDSLQNLLAYGAEKGVRLALEPQCRFVINWLNTVRETLDWIEGFPHRAFVLFDTYHAMLEERSISAAMIHAYPSISWVQISDSNRRAPGSGQMHLGEPIRVLRALGYQGFVCVECLPQPDGATAARQAAHHLHPYLREES